jgi:hypothetical protein
MPFLIPPHPVLVSALIGMGDLSGPDWLALLCVTIGVVTLLTAASRRPDIGVSIFVSTVGAGAWLVFSGRFAAALSLHQLAIRFASSASLLWACLGYLSGLGRKMKRDHVTPSTVFFIWAMLTGVSAGVMISYRLFVLLMPRMFDPNQPHMHTAPPEGILFIAILFAATALWRAREQKPEQPVFFLILGGMTVWWSAMILPNVNTPPQLGRLYTILPLWWSWLFQLEAGLALLLLTAATIQDLGYRRRREAAWPERLDDLLEPYSRWPAYIQIEAMIAAAVLLLGAYELVAGGAPSVARSLASCVAAIIAGYSCLFMTYRRWSGNAAGLGMALISLGAMSAASGVAFVLIPTGIASQYPLRMPMQFNAILFAMAVMAALWRWLGHVWEQQVLEGTAWTTTGKMTYFTRRTSFFLLAIALLVAFQMAFWPQYKYGSDDDSGGRMICGIMALSLLALIATRIARRDQSSAEASLAVAFIIAAVAFVMIRLPTSSVRGWMGQYQALVVSALAMPVFLVAELLEKSKWRSFALPLCMLTLLIMPVAALANLLKFTMPSEWVRPLTLAILGLLYGIAGRHAQRRGLLVLGGVLLIAAASTLLRSYGKSLFAAV